MLAVPKHQPHSPPPARPLGTGLREFAVRAFAIDYRSLALFRVTLAAMLLYDVLGRAMNLRAHYTDWGTLPRAVLVEKHMSDWQWSIHLMSGTWQVQGLLFLVAAIAAVSLLVGYRTRFAAITSWVLLTSLHNRNPMVLQGGDFLLRMEIFWAMFLPLGMALSVDSARRSPRETLRAAFSWATAALLLQPVLMHVFSALLKTGPQWRVDGSAIGIALLIEQFTTPFGVWARQFTGVWKVMTPMVVWFEGLGSLLLFSPVFFAPIRLLGIALLCGMHLGFMLCLNVGHFPFVSWISLLPFVPAEAWDWLGARPATTKARLALARAVETASWLLRRLPPAAPAAPTGRIANMLACGALCLVIGWNLGTIPTFPFALLKPFEKIAQYARLDQRWDMFSPFPLTEDGWYVIPGKLRDGSEVDLFRNGATEVTFQKPALVSALYPEERWRKYMMRLWEKASSDHRLYFGRYLCREWNLNRPPEKLLMSFRLFFILERITPNLKKDPPQKTLLWDHQCFGPNEVLPPLSVTTRAPEQKGD